MSSAATSTGVHEIDAILAACRDVIAGGGRGLLVTITATRGSTYRRPGARAVIASDGRVWGMISGGCLERDLAERAEVWLAGARPMLHTYDAHDDAIFGLGLECRSIDMLIEPFDAASPPRLLREFRWNGREPVSSTTELDGETPADIALSIVAEIQASLHGRSGAPLRERSGAIRANGTQEMADEWRR